MQSLVIKVFILRDITTFIAAAVESTSILVCHLLLRSYQKVTTKMVVNTVSSFTKKMVAASKYVCWVLGEGIYLNLMKLMTISMKIVVCNQ